VDAHLFTDSAAAFRSVLADVHGDQLDRPTPCEPLSVAQLIERAIGHTDWVRDALHGGVNAAHYPHIDPADYLPEFDRAVAAMLDELNSDGAMTRSVTLARGLSFCGHDVMILAARNLFQYAWDLARAIGQSTAFAPQTATELLELSHTRVVPQRGPGRFFGPAFVPPAHASPADRLAGFLGRIF
jgi:uncharacterized protein (TIGR03086 family)